MKTCGEQLSSRSSYGKRYKKKNFLITRYRILNFYLVLISLYRRYLLKTFSRFSYLRSYLDERKTNEKGRFQGNMLRSSEADNLIASDTLDRLEFSR